MSKISYPNPFHPRTTLGIGMSASFESFTHPFLGGPPISSCPRKRDGREDPYRSKWAQAELSRKITDCMWLNNEEMEGNYYGSEQLHANNCLMTSYCPKNPYKRKNLLSTELRPEQNMSLMDPHWAEQQKKTSFMEVPSNSYNIKEQRDFKRKFPKQDDKIPSDKTANQKPFGKITFGEEGFHGIKRANRLNSQESEISDMMESPKFETKVGLKNMVKRMSSSHDYEDRTNFTGYPSTLEYKDQIFQVMPLT